MDQMLAHFFDGIDSKSFGVTNQKIEDVIDERWFSIRSIMRMEK